MRSLVYQRVLDRSIELRRFVATGFPGRAGGHITFGTAGRIGKEGVQRYVSVNVGIRGIPWWEYAERGIARKNEILVLTLGRAAGGGSVHAEASLLRHLVHEGGYLVVGASRHICPECAARLFQHNIQSAVPFRLLGTDPNPRMLKSGKIRYSGMVRFLHVLTGADEAAISGLGRAGLEDLRNYFFPKYPRRAGPGFGKPFPGR